MRSRSRLFSGPGLGLWTLLAIGCGSKSEHATREECTQVSEHIADLIIAEAKANPDALFDALQDGSGESGIPADVTKPVFKVWLDSTQGQTWMMQRRGQTLAGTQQGIDICVKNATREQVKCLLASKTREDVAACDRARHPGGAAPAGSAAPALGGDGSAAAGSAAAGSVGSDGSGEGSAPAGSGSGAGSAAH